MTTRTHQYRTAAGEARLVRSLDCDKLPPAVQERLSLCLGEGGAPAPLLQVLHEGTEKIPGRPRFYTFLGVFAGALEATLWFAYFGDLSSEFALQRGNIVGAHVLAMALLCLAVLAHVGFRRSKSVGAPFPQGRFLFAKDLVETHGRLLTVTSLDTLRTVESHGKGAYAEVRLVFRDGASIPLRAYGDDPLATARNVELEIERAASLVLPDDQPTLERIDPFFELRIAENWASAEAQTGGDRPLPRFAWFLAASLAFGVAFGPLLLFLRNFASDESMFAQVREAAEQGSDEAFEKRQQFYQWNGNRHRAEADDLRFERASKSIEPLARYLRDFPESQHSAEADDKLYEMAKSARTMAAYGLYLGAKGQKHRVEADDALFAKAKREGTPFAYRQYLEGHGKEHKDEIEKALLPEAEIKAARNRRDVPRLLEIAKEQGSGIWVDAARDAAHGVYQDLLLALRRRQGLEGLDVKALFEPLLSHADRQLEPRIKLTVTVGRPEQIVTADGLLGATHGMKYVRAAQLFDAEALRAPSGEVANLLAQHMRTAFGEALVLVQNPKENSREWGILEANLEAIDGAQPFTTTDGRSVFCDVRFRLDLHAYEPAGHWTRSVTFSTPRAPLNPDVYSVVARLVSDVKVEDAYVKMAEGMPKELGALLEKMLRDR